jgi:hypothetical protein
VTVYESEAHSDWADDPDHAALSFWTAMVPPQYLPNTSDPQEWMSFSHWEC